MMTKSLWRQVLLASVLGLGALAVWTVLGAYICALLPSPEKPMGFGESVAFLADGTPLIMQRFDTSAEPEYCDLERHPVVPELENGQLIPTFLSKTWGNMGVFNSQRLADGLNPSGYWYLVQAEGKENQKGYFVGFDSQSKHVLGYIGINGFQKNIPSRDEMISGVRRGEQEQGLVYVTGAPIGRSVPMPGPMNPVAFKSVFVPSSDGKLYLVDLQERTIRPVHQGEPLQSAAGFNTPFNAIIRTKWEIVLRTDRSVLVLDAQGHLQHRFPIPPAIQNEDFQFGVTNANEAVMESASSEGSLSNTTSVRLFHVHKDNSVAETHLTLLNQAIGLGFQAYGGIQAPSPVLLAAMIGLDRGSEIYRLNLEPTLGAAIQRLIVEYRQTFALALILSALLAIACSVRLARFRATRMERIVWPVFVLLFGLPAWVGFRFGRTWPILENCSHCNAKVPKDQTECLACSKEFPAPIELGTEVFA